MFLRWGFLSSGLTASVSGRTTLHLVGPITISEFTILLTTLQIKWKKVRMHSERSYLMVGMPDTWDMEEH